MLRNWKCTNPNCEMNLKGLIVMNSQPAYAQVKCEKCGAPMVNAEGNTEVIFVGNYPDTMLSSGALPVAKSKQGFFASLGGRKQTCTVADPDIASYPQMEGARANYQLLRPDMAAYLQTADLFLAQSLGQAQTMAVARCPSHHLARPLSSNPPVGIHVEAHLIDQWYVFGVYVLVWDNPNSPWFAETTVCPYDMIGANETEMAHPFTHGYFWRKLFYLLAQDKTELLFLNENHQIAAQRTAILLPGQAGQFDKLLTLLESLAGKQIHKPDLLKVHTHYNQAVDIKGVQSRLPRL